MPLDEQMQKSDTVVVAKVTSNGQDPDWSKFTVLSVRAVLKGNPGGEVSVWTVTGFPESDFACCTVGDEYVVFLHKNEKNMYSPINGRNSFVPIKAQ